MPAASQRYRRTQRETDGRTDGQTDDIRYQFLRCQHHALHYVHRAIKIGLRLPKLLQKSKNQCSLAFMAQRV